MPLPTFLVSALPRAALPRFAAYLAQHPEVFFSRTKEPNFFALTGGEVSPEAGPAPAARAQEHYITGPGPIGQAI